MSFVAHTDLGGGVGAVVNQDDYNEADWAYMVEHGNVVVRGSNKDPNVLAARAAGEAYEDPRDQRIADLEARLAALGEPVDEEAEPDPDQVDAQAKVDAEQAKTGPSSSAPGGPAK